MIFVTIRMKVCRGKRTELSQTIASLVSAIMTEQGCRACKSYCSMEDENKLYLFEAWESRKDFECHQESETFKILLGAITLLDIRHEIKLYCELPPTFPEDLEQKNGDEVTPRSCIAGSGRLVSRGFRERGDKCNGATNSSTFVREEKGENDPEDRDHSAPAVVAVP